MSVLNVYHDVSRETGFNFFLPLRHVIPVFFYISMGKPIGSQFGQKVSKIRTGKFRPEIAFTNQYHLPKNSREGLKLVENEFPFGTFRPKKQDYLFRCSVAPGNFPSKRP